MAELTLAGGGKSRNKLIHVAGEPQTLLKRIAAASGVACRIAPSALVRAPPRHIPDAEEAMLLQL